MKDITWREKLLKMAQIDILYMINDNLEKLTDDNVLSYPCCRELVTGKRCNCPDESDNSTDGCKRCLERLLGEVV